MMKARMLGGAVLGLLLAACGTDPQGRVAGGAAAGAATGAGVGALGGPVGALAGAGIGAAAGATTGAATSPEQLNLGRPVWEDPELRVPGTAAGGATQAAAAQGGARRPAPDPQTRDLQRALRDRGFDPGPVDGISGPKTREAVREWQRQNNMQATGRPDQQMLGMLGIAAPSRAGAPRAPDRRDPAGTGSQGRVSPPPSVPAPSGATSPPSLPPPSQGVPVR